MNNPNEITVDYSTQLPYPGKLKNTPQGTRIIQLHQIRTIQPVKAGQPWVHGDTWLDLANSQRTSSGGLSNADAFLMMSLLNDQDRIPPAINTLKGKILLFAATQPFLEERVNETATKKPAVNLPAREKNEKDPASEIVSRIVNRQYFYYMQWLFVHWIYGQQFFEGAFDEKCLAVCLEHKSL